MPCNMPLTIIDQFEELSPESYLVRTEDGFWVSDATQGTLYHIKRSNSPSEVS